MRFRKGMAGLILLVMIMGYMMMISTSSTFMIQSEATGKSTRKSYKNAYYAAVAGVGVVMSRLRLEPTTFDVLLNERPYFSRVNNDTDNHWREETGANATFSGYGTLIYPGWIAVSSAFTVNTDINNDDYQFILCSYPYVDPVTSYEYIIIKSQGKFVEFDLEKEFKAQIWARFRINAPAKLISMESFGNMGVQDLTVAAGTEVNDFWDWQSDFQ